MRTISERNSEKRSRFLMRTAKEIRNYTVRKKISVALLSMLTLVTALLYVVATLYKQSGSFTVSIDKYDMTKYGLSLSETRDMAQKTATLNAKIDEEITNIAGEWIPEDVDMIDGEHNGDDYIAYTFYLENSGSVEVPVEYEIGISNITNGLDEAIRIRLYRDGEATTYAKTKNDGSGPEEGTTEFYSDKLAMRDRIENFNPGQTMKFTVVIWVEGNDPECVDWLIGGKLRVDMNMSIIH